MRPAAVAVFLTCLWMAVTVHYNYQGNWTALFCIGDRFLPPDLVRAEHPYVFSNSPGYDGQFYHDIAHDPLLSHGTSPYIDAPRLRQRRILVPALAWLIAMGRQPWIDAAYFTVMLFFVGAGTFWFARYAVEQLHLTEWCGLLYLAVPSTLISIDRMTTDLALTSLFMGFVYYLRKGPVMVLWILAAAACLTRETGLCMLAGYTVYLLWKRLYWSASLFATSATPFFAWTLVVAARTPKGAEPALAGYPFSAFIGAFTHPQTYPGWPSFRVVLQAFDMFTLIAFLAALLLVVRKDSLAWIVMPFVALAAVLGSLPGEYADVYGYARPFSPILLVVLLDGLAKRSFLRFAVFGIVSARAGLLIAWQAANVVRRMFG